jgi:hypothetical protein
MRCLIHVVVFALTTANKWLKQFFGIEVLEKVQAELIPQ